MELLALDSSFQPIAYLPYFNLQWTREYYKIGQFSVQVAAASYDPAMAYLYNADRPETGIIQKVELTETVKGRFVQLSGYFLEAILNDKVVYPTYYANGSIPATVVAMLRQYKDDIPLLTVADAPAEQADETSWQETGGQLADVAYSGRGNGSAQWLGQAGAVSQPFRFVTRAEAPKTERRITWKTKTSSSGSKPQSSQPLALLVPHSAGLAG